jgi:hypothetical protein
MNHPKLEETVSTVEWMVVKVGLILLAVVGLLKVLIEEIRSLW